MLFANFIISFLSIGDCQILLCTRLLQSCDYPFFILTRTLLADDNNVPRRMLNGRPGGVRWRGKLGMRWEDVEDDLRSLDV